MERDGRETELPADSYIMLLATATTSYRQVCGIIESQLPTVPTYITS